MLDYPFSDASTSCYRDGTPLFRTTPGSPYTVYNHGEIQPPTGLDSPLFYASYLRYNIYTDSI